MSATIKVLKKIAAQVQSAAIYDDDGMLLQPFLSGDCKQVPDYIENESIIGVAFKDLPAQGNLHTTCTVSQLVDKVSIIPILTGALGSVASSVYKYLESTGNATALSICASDGVTNNKFANQYIKSFKLAGSKGDFLKLDWESIGSTNIDRVVPGTYPFPSVTSPGSPLLFHHCGGTNGHVRIGDLADALTSGDNINIEDFSLEVITGFDEQFANDSDAGNSSLTPVNYMVAPSIKFSFKIPRHETNQYLTWAEAETPLQMSLYFYRDATNKLKIDLPRIIINPQITEDEIAGISVECMVGRNGTGTSYINTNFSYHSPVGITVEA